MFGWTELFLGHLTSSGTIANLEALWVAGQLAPGKRIVGSEQAHYTHRRISEVLKLEYAGSRGRQFRGRMSLEGPRSRTAQGRCGHRRGHAGHHGHWRGRSARRNPETAVALWLPGACGCGVRRLFPADRGPASTSRHTERFNLALGGRLAGDRSAQAWPAALRMRMCPVPRPGRGAAFTNTIVPYTYFTSKELHLGEISLECSRAGAAAVALWATQQLLPLIPGGEFAQRDWAARAAALELDRRLRRDAPF
jgi:tyrosine decarboxylase/aspartate 1-decarboxylase